MTFASPHGFPDQADTAPPDASSVSASRLQRSIGTAGAGFNARDGVTRLKRLRQSGCLKLRFPRLPGAAAEAILINSSGGLAGGDRLDQSFAAGAGADVTVTTQACERVYRAASEGRPVGAGDAAEVTTRLAIAEGARFAWLPQETILFDGGALRRTLEIDAAEGADFLAGEAVILGRERMGEAVRRGFLHDRWRVRVGGRLVYADDLRLDGDVPATIASAACLNGARAFASVVCRSKAGEALLPTIRDLVGREGGASSVASLVVVRLAAPTGLALRRKLIPVLSALAERRLPLVWSL